MRWIANLAVGGSFNPAADFAGGQIAFFKAMLVGGVHLNGMNSVASSPTRAF